MKKDKILITGGFGFIGYHLTNYLLSIQRNVIVFGNKSEHMKEPFRELEKKYGEKLELIEGDILEDDLHNLVHKENNIVGVFHLAAIKSTTQTRDKDNADLLLTNYSIDCEVFAFCEDVISHRDVDDKRGLKLIYISTGEIYGKSFNKDIPLPETWGSKININDKESLYPLSKMMGEMSLRFSKNSFDWNIVRLQNPYGPYMSENMLIPFMIKCAIGTNTKGKSIFELDSGNDSRPFVWIGDVVIGLGHVFGKAKSGEVYNLAGHDIALAEMVRNFAEKYSPNMFVKVNKANEGIHRRMDCSKIKRDNIWEPFTSIEQGLELMYSFYYKKFLVEQSMKQIGL